MNARKACRWATYPGDCTGNIGRFVGPNTLGEVLHIVSEDYNPGSDSTRVGFAYGLPAARAGEQL